MRLLPTGVCWCGCGDDRIGLGSFFAPGHDKRAEAKVIAEVFGGVPQFLYAMGYVPKTAATRLNHAAKIRKAIEAAGLAEVLRELTAMTLVDPQMAERVAAVARACAEKDENET